MLTSVTSSTPLTTSGKLSFSINVSTMKREAQVYSLLEPYAIAFYESGILSFMILSTQCGHTRPYRFLFIQFNSATLEVFYLFDVLIKITHFKLSLHCRNYHFYKTHLVFLVKFQEWHIGKVVPVTDGHVLLKDQVHMS